MKKLRLIYIVNHVKALHYLKGVALIQSAHIPLPYSVQHIQLGQFLGRWAENWTLLFGRAIGSLISLYLVKKR